MFRMLLVRLKHRVVVLLGLLWLKPVLQQLSTRYKGAGLELFT